MIVKVELVDFFSKIEGEEIAAYHAYIIDENEVKWKYAYNRQPRQSIEQFVQEVKDAFQYNRDDDFRNEG